MAKFYKCEVCGNLVDMVLEGGGKLVCCGQDMKELVANTTDAAKEKHVPVVTVEGNVVKVVVGSTEHPMTEEHHIAFIVLETDKGVHRVNLEHTSAPKAEFALADGEKPIVAYEFCNLHGLWKAEI